MHLSRYSAYPHLHFHPFGMKACRWLVHHAWEDLHPPTNVELRIAGGMGKHQFACEFRSDRPEGSIIAVTRSVCDHKKRAAAVSSCGSVS